MPAWPWVRYPRSATPAISLMGAGKDRQSALSRLARSVYADLEEIGEGVAMAIARQACRRQKKILVAAIARQAAEHGLDMVVAAGTGEGLQDL